MRLFSRIRAALIVFFLIAPSTLLAHPGAENEVLRRDNLFNAWTWDPLIILLLLVSLVLYVTGVIRMRSRSERNIRLWQVPCFTGGWLALVFALVSPLHKLGSV